MAVYKAIAGVRDTLVSFATGSTAKPAAFLGFMVLWGDAAPDPAVDDQVNEAAIGSLYVQAEAGSVALHVKVAANDEAADWKAVTLAP